MQLLKILSFKFIIKARTENESVAGGAFMRHPIFYLGIITN